MYFPKELLIVAFPGAAAGRGGMRAVVGEAEKLHEVTRQASCSRLNRDCLRSTATRLPVCPVLAGCTLSVCRERGRWSRFLARLPGRPLTCTFPGGNSEAWCVQSSGLSSFRGWGDQVCIPSFLCLGFHLFPLGQALFLEITGPVITRLLTRLDLCCRI